MAAEYADCVDRLELLLGVSRPGHGHHDSHAEKEREKLKEEGKDLVAVIVAGRCVVLTGFNPSDVGLMFRCCDRLWFSIDFRR